MAAVQSQHPLQGTDAFIIAPHDTNTVDAHADNTALYKHCFVYVGVTGDVKVTTVQGKDVTFTAVPAGFILPVVVKRVFNTGTTATNMLGIVGKE